MTKNSNIRQWSKIALYYLKSVSQEEVHQRLTCVLPPSTFTVFQYVRNLDISRNHLRGTYSLYAERETARNFGQLDKGVSVFPPQVIESAGSLALNNVK